MEVQDWNAEDSQLLSGVTPSRAGSALVLSVTQRVKGDIEIY